MPRSGSHRRFVDGTPLGVAANPGSAVRSLVRTHHSCLGFSRGCPHSERGAGTALSPFEHHAFQPRISLLEYLQQHGWKPVRDNGREELAGLCPLHRDTHPSFYVNRRKQVFYCHGCGRGGGLSRLIHLPGDLAEPAPEHLLEHTYRFHQRQLERFEEAPAYLAKRGIQDRAAIERMRIGYAPGACLRGYPERLGYGRQFLRDCGLVDDRGRDSFFRSLVFPLEHAGNLYARSMGNYICRHRFLPGSKGGLYAWAATLAFSRLILVEGLLDLAA